jgi:chromosome segregation ATPase
MALHDEHVIAIDNEIKRLNSWNATQVELIHDGRVKVKSVEALNALQAHQISIQDGKIKSLEDEINMRRTAHNETRRQLSKADDTNRGMRTCNDTQVTIIKSQDNKLTENDGLLQAREDRIKALESNGPRYDHTGCNNNLSDAKEQIRAQRNTIRKLQSDLAVPCPYNHATDSVPNKFYAERGEQISSRQRQLTELQAQIVRKDIALNNVRGARDRFIEQVRERTTEVREKTSEIRKLREQLTNPRVCTKQHFSDSVPIGAFNDMRESRDELRDENNTLKSQLRRIHDLT